MMNFFLKMQKYKIFHYMAILFFAQYVWCGLPAEPAAAVKTFFYRRDDKGKIKQQTSKKNGIFNSV
jgi:hypothetical protein